MTKQISRNITALLIISVFGLGLMPAVTSANNDKNKDKKDDKKEKVEKVERHCLKAFGHLFARGWLKKNSEARSNIQIENCFIPFGISKKFRGIASSTPDTTAPSITNLNIRPNTTRAVVTWHTDEKSDSTVFWSTSNNLNVNSSSTLSVTINEMTKEHNVAIENLTASTTYFLVVRSKDASQNSTTSSESSFQTKVPVLDNTAPTISNIAFLISTSTNNVTWHTNENATSRLYYGTSTNLDVNATSTSSVENTALKTNHSLTVNGLTPLTQYYFAAESKDASGNRTVTPIFIGNTLNN